MDGMLNIIKGILVLSLLIAGISTILIEALKGGLTNISKRKRRVVKKKEPENLSKDSISFFAANKGGDKKSSAFKWFLSLLVVIGITIMVVTIFYANKDIWTTADGASDSMKTLAKMADDSSLIFISLLVIISWSTTSLAYVLLVKMLFLGFKTLYNRVEEYYTNSGISLVESKVKLIKNSTLLKQVVYQDALGKIKGNVSVTGAAVKEGKGGSGG